MIKPIGNKIGEGREQRVHHLIEQHMVGEADQNPYG